MLKQANSVSQMNVLAIVQWPGRIFAKNIKKLLVFTWMYQRFHYGRWSRLKDIEIDNYTTITVDS